MSSLAYNSAGSVIHFFRFFFPLTLTTTLPHKIFIALLLFTTIGSHVAWSGVPEVSDVITTDVTPVSFAVVWTTSEASTSDLLIFKDEVGSAVVKNISVKPQPVDSGKNSIATAAEDNGIMKVRISGLQPSTTYYFQTKTTSKSTNDITYYPLFLPLLSVTTESKIVRTQKAGKAEVPFSNDLSVYDCSLMSTELEPKLGTLIVIAVEGCGYPLSAFVGDGAPFPYGYVNLNDLFEKQRRVNKLLTGGEHITITMINDMDNRETIHCFVPVNNQLEEMKPPLNEIP